MSLEGTTEITFQNDNPNQKPSTAVYFDLQDASECLKRLRDLDLEIVKVESF